MLLIPLADGVDAAPLRESFDKQDNAWTLEHKGYLVVFSHEELKKSFPPGKAADLGYLRNYSAGAFQAYINIEEFFSFFNIDMEDMKTAMAEADTGNTEIAAKVLDGYLGLIRQMDSAWGEISAGEMGLESRGDLFFKDEMARFMQTLKPVSGTTGFPVTLEGEDYFFAGVFNLDPRDRAVLTDKIYAFFLDAGAGADESVTEYLALSKKMNDTIGPRGSFAMNMKIHPEAINSDDPSDMMDLQFTAAMELSDPDMFEASLIELYAHPGMDGLFKAMYGDEGPGWNISLEKKKYGNTVYREMSYQIPEQSSMAEAAALLEKMKIYYVIQDSICFMYMSLGGEPVEKFLKKTASGVFRADVNEQPDWVVRAPDSAHFIWNTRMSGFMNMVPLAQGKMASLMPPEPAGISGYVAVDQGLLSRAFIPSGEILWLIQSFAMLRASLGQQ
jgi:hypothetical protein